MVEDLFGGKNVHHPRSGGGTGRRVRHRQTRSLSPLPIYAYIPSMSVSRELLWDSVGLVYVDAHSGTALGGDGGLCHGCCGGARRRVGGN